MTATMMMAMTVTKTVIVMVPSTMMMTELVTSNRTHLYQTTLGLGSPLTRQLTSTCLPCPVSRLCCSMETTSGGNITWGETGECDDDI